MKEKEMQELDVYLAEKVMGWKFTEVHPDSTLIYIYEGEKKVVGNYIDWHPTTNIAQAFEVMEKVQKEDFWFSCSYKSGIFLSDINKGGWQVRFRCVRGGTRGEYWAEHEDLKRAICLAAKKTWEAK